MLVKICMVILAITQILILRKLRNFDSREEYLVEKLFEAEERTHQWHQACIDNRLECNRLQEELIKAKWGDEHA